MNWEQVLGVAVVVVLLMFSMLVLLARHVAQDWLNWRTRVEGKIDKLDPNRMEEHYTKVHGLSNKVFELSMTSGRLDKDSQDHEERLRLLEIGKVGVP